MSDLVALHSVVYACCSPKWPSGAISLHQQPWLFTFPFRKPDADPHARRNIQGRCYVYINQIVSFYIRDRRTLPFKY
jgi:hypothetical protein